MHASVIICTRNRAPSLEKTLRAVGQVSVPEGWRAELILVDNASTDQTPDVVRNGGIQNFKVRYLYESQTGKSQALNAGVALAQGEVILFTDDDVAPARDWLERMATPLLRHECDAVLGTIALAPALKRSWMEPLHQMWLAATEASGQEITDLIGANMAIHRSVFERIPLFDPELGPGASGFGEETLLYRQMREAGFHMQPVAATVTHYPETTRLLRSEWLAQARKRGRTAAYILHHWQHDKLSMPWVRFCCTGAKLLLRRVIQPPPPLDGEGCPAWEMSYVGKMEMCRRFLEECRRPRNYMKHGLRKRCLANLERSAPGAGTGESRTAYAEPGAAGGQREKIG